MEMQPASAELSVNDKAILEELMREVGNNSNTQGFLSTYGLVKNQVTGTSLSLSDRKTWCGSVMSQRDIILHSGQQGTFVHQGVYPNGSKGGFVHAEPNGFKRLVAYHTPANKVYVEAGETISPWDVVEERLDSGFPAATNPWVQAVMNIGQGYNLVVTFTCDVN